MGARLTNPVIDASIAAVLLTKIAVRCDYCGRDAELVSGEVIYPHRPDLFAKQFWRCAPCEAFVGCHEAGNGYGDGTRPLGRLANFELRRAKMRAHAAFDPLWKAKGMRRREAYAWLAKQMGIDPSQCHIGMFDVERCQEVVGIVVSQRFGRMKGGR